MDICFGDDIFFAFYIGLPEEVNTRNGVEKRLMLELADQSSQTILMTVWGDMAQYLKDQCLLW